MKKCLVFMLCLSFAAFFGSCKSAGVPTKEPVPVLSNPNNSGTNNDDTPVEQSTEFKLKDGYAIMLTEVGEKDAEDKRKFTFKVTNESGKEVQIVNIEVKERENEKVGNIDNVILKFKWNDSDSQMDFKCGKSGVKVYGSAAGVYGGTDFKKGINKIFKLVKRTNKNVYVLQQQVS